MHVVFNDNGYVRIGNVEGRGVDANNNHYLLVDGCTAYCEDVIASLNERQVGRFLWELREARGVMRPWEAIEYVKDMELL